MVCVPCIVIPFLLWVFHKWVQPFILKFWNPWTKKSVTDTQANGDGPPKDDLYTSKEGQFIKEKITQNPVMLFSKTTCNYCKMAKDLLGEIGVSYCVEELDKRDDCAPIQDTLLKITGARTVPRVFIGEKCIGGASEAWSLHNQGKLVELLKQAGATFKKTD